MTRVDSSPPCVPVLKTKGKEAQGGGEVLTNSINDERERQSLEILKAFESVGVRSFNLSRTDIDRQIVAHRPYRNLGGMRMLLPEWVRLSSELEQNLIVRAHQPAPRDYRAALDDLTMPANSINCKAALFCMSKPALEVFNFGC